MSLRSNVTKGLRSLFRKRAIESEMDEELSAFVEASAADKLHRGMMPDEAARAVRSHGGTIRAENAAPRRLRIQIVLPVSLGESGSA